MNELKRVCSKKNIVLMAIVAVLNLSLFYLSCDDNLSITLQGEELESYIASYPDFIKYTYEQSRLQLILGEKDGFTEASIIKTAEDYGRLENITLTLSDNRGINLLSDHFLSDIFLGAVVFIAVFSLSDVRRKGLLPVVRSTFRGRTPLFLKGVLTVFAAAIGGAVLIYGGNFLVIILRYGVPDMQMQIQSVPEFKLCPFDIKSGEYLLLMYLIKTFGIASAGAAFYALSYAGTGLTYAASSVFAAFELAASRIPAVSEYNFFGIFNIFSLIRSKELFSRYCNINILGRPVTAVRVSLFFGGVLLVLSLAAGIFFNEIVYADGLFGEENFFERIKRYAEKHGRCRSLFSWEIYKLVFKQKGGIIVLLMFGAMLFQSAQYDYFYPIDPYEFEWYAKYEGDITEKTLTDMTKEKDRLENFIDRLNNSLEKLLAQESYDPRELGRILSYLEEATAQLNELTPLLDNVKSAMEYTARTGNTLMLIKPYAYELLFVRDEKTVSRAALIILAGIIFAVSGTYSADGREDIRAITRATLKGRIRLDICKIFSVMILCALLCLSVHSVQLIKINGALGFEFPDAPVQSLEFMRDFEPYISISSYIFLMMCARTAAAFGAAGVILIIGRAAADRSKTIGISAFVSALSVFCGLGFGSDIINILFLLGVRKL
ncbi:MAG: hypothetical protein NC120_11155 [Ruminococcus sp.]|nr:hypothetical protein [Ruminococcus sp.]